MFLICSKGFKFDFQNRKWNNPNKKWNYFFHFQASDQKTCFTKCFSFVPRDSKLFFKTGNGFIQSGNMELFLPLPGLWSKNLFYNISSILTKEFRIGFQNRKCNYCSHFQASYQKTSFTTSSSFFPRSSKLIFKTGNGIIQTGNGII